MAANQIMFCKIISRRVTVCQNQVNFWFRLHGFSGAGSRHFRPSGYKSIGRSGYQNLSGDSGCRYCCRSGRESRHCISPFELRDGMNGNNTCGTEYLLEAAMPAFTHVDCWLHLVQRSAFQNSAHVFEKMLLFQNLRLAIRSTELRK